MQSSNRSRLIFVIVSITFLFIAGLFYFKNQNTSGQITDKLVPPTHISSTPTQIPTNIVHEPSLITFIKLNDRDNSEDDEINLVNTETQELNSLGIKNVSKVLKNPHSPNIIYQLNGTENKNQILIYNLETKVTDVLKVEENNKTVILSEINLSPDGNKFIYTQISFPKVDDSDSYNEANFNNKYFIYDIKNKSQKLISESQIKSISWRENSNEIYYLETESDNKQKFISQNLENDSKTLVEEIDANIIYYFRKENLTINLKKISEHNNSMIIKVDQKEYEIDNGDILSKIEYSPSQTALLYFKKENPYDLTKKIINLSELKSESAIGSNLKNEYVEFINWLDDENIIVVNTKVEEIQGEREYLKNSKSDIYVVNIKTLESKKITNIEDIKTY